MTKMFTAMKEHMNDDLKRVETKTPKSLVFAFMIFFYIIPIAIASAITHWSLGNTARALADLESGATSAIIFYAVYRYVTWLEYKEEVKRLVSEWTDNLTESLPKRNS